MPAASFARVDDWPLAGGGIWRAELDCVADQNADAGVNGIDWLEGHVLLDQTERARAERFVRRQDALRYARAHIALRQCLAQRVGAQPAALRIETTPDGKPYLPDHPQLAFNLSHSGPEAWLVERVGAAVGLDVERLDRRQTGDGQWAQSVLSALEQQQWASLRTHPQAMERLLLLWTRKEAVLKWLGVGLTQDPTRLHIGFAPLQAPIHINAQACTGIVASVKTGVRLESRRYNAITLVTLAEHARAS